MSLDKEHFDQLLSWLDSDLLRAGEKYEKIRRRLILFFLGRQCQEAEDQADETINRVAKKVGELKDKYVGDPASYFYGVAKKVHLEYIRKQSKPIPTPPPMTSHEEREPEMVCLDECLAQLTPEQKEFILLYFQEQKRAKITSHQEMSRRMGLNPGAVRARVHRIRTKLEKCMQECLKRSTESNDTKADNIQK